MVLVKRRLGALSYFPHLFSAAFFAISDRLSGVSFVARALPPFKPPNRPKLTAAGFFSCLFGFSACPVAC